MAKKHKSKAQSYGHMMGSPQDMASHPLNNLPAPAGGAMTGQVMPGAPMLPGEPLE